MAGGKAPVLVVTALLAWTLALPAAAQQLTPDEAATQMLNAARRGYNEANYPFAADRFREFLKQFGGHKDAAAAQYGLALSLLELPEKDFKGISEALQPAVARADFPDRPFALYYLGVAQRGLGDFTLAQMTARPAEAVALRNTAMQQFGLAGQNFAAAAAAFVAQLKAASQPASGPGSRLASGPGSKPATAAAPVPTPAPVPAAAPAPVTPVANPQVTLEWVARAKTDQCEMLLRAGKYKEAAAVAVALLADAKLEKSPYRGAALYHLGHANFELKEYPAAGKALSQLAPFQQEFGVHARYLLARVHHMCGERPEAAGQYKAVLAGYEEQKKAAQPALANPALKPEQRAFWQAVVAGPPPEYIQRAAFYVALLLTEEARYADAVTGFTALMTQYPKSPLIPEAQLRLGYCHLQLKNPAEAVKALQPLAEHPQLSDRALWWLARAQVAGADPANAPAYAQAIAAAIGTLGRAAERAKLLMPTDPDAKVRRGDILLELADTQQLAKQYKEAVATYQQVLAENNNPDRAEEALQRQATAMHLSGQYAASDQLCQKFEQTYPKSTLLPAILFRAAENAYFTATVTPEPPPDALKKQLGEAITRYQRLLKQCPDFAHANMARLGVGMAQYRLGKYPEAVAAFSAIPDADRAGDLALVPYLLADCLIRTFPPEGDDAVSAARLLEQAETAAKLLDGFVGPAAPPPAPAPPAVVAPPNPQLPDALLKLGYCYQRFGAVAADPAERNKVFTQAKEAYERLIKLFPADPAVPTAVFERAKCLMLLGDVANARNELSRFRTEPLRSAVVAPAALVRLSALLRAQNQVPEAVKVMTECLAIRDAGLAKNLIWNDWNPAIQYEHALTIKESAAGDVKKLAEARTLFEALAKQAAGKPEGASAIWRMGQCRREELMAALAAARATMAKPGVKGEEIAAAGAVIADHAQNLQASADAMQAQAAELAKKGANSEPHLRLLYEIAWCYRMLANAQIEQARQKLQKEAIDKVLAKLAKDTTPGQAPPTLRGPEIPLSAIPAQPAEKLVREQYQRLIAAGPDSALAVQGRFELAEVLAQRAAGAADFDQAAALLAEALEKNPPPDLIDRIKLRLAGCLLGKNDPKTALVNVQSVLKKPAAPQAAEARYLAGEAYIQQKDWLKAIEQLATIRDQGPLQNVPEVSDRALLRLGYACAQAGQWEPSRQALEILTQRFPQSPWVEEARYGIGWAWQNLKQHDNAVVAYTEVTRRTPAELAAKAQLQIGLCRLEQKRHPEAIKALESVGFTYDYPEPAAAALCEAGRAHQEANQPAEAAKDWQRVLADFPASSWAKLAQERLGKMK